MAPGTRQGHPRNGLPHRSLRLHPDPGLTPTTSDRRHPLQRRLDHANIFLIIAGTYTPLTVLLLPDSTGRTLLWAVWAAAVAGI
ncbi:hemolysin III family protein, partial [Streptomyces goshikiensis]